MATFGFNRNILPNILTLYASLSKEMSKSRKGEPPSVTLEKHSSNDYKLDRYTQIVIFEKVEKGMVANRMILQLNPETGDVKVYTVSDDWKRDAAFVVYLAETHLVKVAAPPMDRDEALVAATLGRPGSAPAKASTPNWLTKAKKGIFGRAGKRSIRRQTKRR
jgi:hypothetical protein